MSEYDNTNTGAGFKPFEDSKMVLQGNLDVDGMKKEVIYVASTLKDGRKVLKVYEKFGIMFEQDKETGSNKPDYSGPIDTMYKKAMAGWRKTSQSGVNFLSVKVSEKQTTQEDTMPNDNVQYPAQDPLDDVIPF